MSQTSLISLFGNVVEQIKENFTSEKLFKAADNCLYDGVKVVLDNTTLIEECLAIYLSISTRKQIFNTSDSDLVEKLAYRFFFADQADKLEILQKMKLNRDLLLLPVSLFVDCYQPYCRAIVSGSPLTLDLRKALHVRDLSKDLTLPLLHVKASHKNYVDMREAILEKYYRMIVKDLGKIYPILKDKIDMEDAGAEYYASALKAFAKFDITAGPFTSYLAGWFKNAKSMVFNDEIGVAFLIPPTLRFKIANGNSGVNNFGLELEKYEDVGVKSSIDLAQQSDDDAVKQIVSMFDHSGIYRLINEMELAR